MLSTALSSMVPKHFEIKKFLGVAKNRPQKYELLWGAEKYFFIFLSFWIR